MQHVRARFASIVAVAASACVGCGGEDDTIRVAQGETSQTVARSAGCDAGRFVLFVCSKERSYPRTKLDESFAADAPAQISFPGVTRVEIALLRENGGTATLLDYDEEQCIDSVCLTSTELNRRLMRGLRGEGRFVRVVIFGEQRRGFELQLAAP